MKKWGSKWNDLLTRGALFGELDAAAPEPMESSAPEPRNAMTIDSIEGRASSARGGEGSDQVEGPGSREAPLRDGSITPLIAGTTTTGELQQGNHSDSLLTQQQQQQQHRRIGSADDLAAAEIAAAALEAALAGSPSPQLPSRQGQEGPSASSAVPPPTSQSPPLAPAGASPVATPAPSAAISTSSVRHSTRPALTVNVPPLTLATEPIVGGMSPVSAAATQCPGRHRGVDYNAEMNVLETNGFSLLDKGTFSHFWCKVGSKDICEFDLPWHIYRLDQNPHTFSHLRSRSSFCIYGPSFLMPPPPCNHRAPLLFHSSRPPPRPQVEYEGQEHTSRMVQQDKGSVAWGGSESLVVAAVRPVGDAPLEIVLHGSRDIR